MTAVKEGERNVPHAVGLGVIMQKGPDLESWDCNGRIIWKEVEYRQRQTVRDRTPGEFRLMDLIVCGRCPNV